LLPLPLGGRSFGINDIGAGTDKLPRRVTFDPRILERNILQGSKSLPAFFAFEPVSI
jgi:hypothetical protein